jgi:DNA-binding transcriptional LysR family regulator
LLALEAAKAGTGIALVPDFLAAEALNSGVIELLDDTMVPSGRTYRLCYKAARSNEPVVRASAK